MTRVAAVAVALVLCSCSVVEHNRRSIARKYERLGFHVERRTLTSGAMVCRVGGAGFPVLLVHGFGGTALETWEHQVRDLVRGGYRVVAPDIYWFGDSVPRGGMDTAADQADAIAELLTQLGIRKAHVVGISFGGFISLELARRHPARVGKLVLIDSAGLKLTPEEHRAMLHNFGASSSITEVLVPRDEEHLKRFLDKVFYEPRWIPKFVLRELLHKEFWKHKEAKKRILLNMERGGLLPPAALAAVHAETYVIWGERDLLLPPSLGVRLARALPSARLAYVPRSGHAPTLEQPVQSTWLIMRFLDG